MAGNSKWAIISVVGGLAISAISAIRAEIHNKKIRDIADEEHKLYVNTYKKQFDYWNDRVVEAEARWITLEDK